MSSHGAAPAPERFDLGPEGFVVQARFVLAESDWKGALGYCRRLAAISTGDISFNDVLLYLTNLQASAGAWINGTYPTEIVSLADNVVHYATQTGVYFPALAQTLDALGSDPSNSGLLQQVNAILQVLNKAPGEQTRAAREAAHAAQRFVSGVAAGEKKLRPLFDAYVSIYLQPTPRVQLLLPEDLDRAVIALESAWKRLSDTLDQLKKFVDKKAGADEPFSVDIAAPGSVALWKIAGDAADNWRRDAFTG
jgi:hypothetical protein